MVLKLKESIVLTQEEAKTNDNYNIPNYTWHYIDGFSHIETHSKLKSQIINKKGERAPMGYTNIYTLPNIGEDIMCVIVGFDTNGNFHKIATSLEAYLMDASGKTIERLN